MFGCCNSLFGNGCRCRTCGSMRCGCGQSGGGSPVPMPIYPPVTPPSNPPQLRGMQLSLVGSSADILEPGARVPFDALNSNNTLGVTYSPGSGVINLTRTGTYLVNWWVAVEDAQEAESLAFALSVNGSDVQTSYADVGGGQIYGTAIVNVASIPSTMSLVNRSAGEVTYVTAPGQGGLTVTQMA